MNHFGEGTSSTSRAQAPIHISVSFVRPGNEKKNRQPSMPSGWQTGEKNHSNIILYTLLPHSMGWWVAPTYWQTFFLLLFCSFFFSPTDEVRVSQSVTPQRTHTYNNLTYTNTHTYKLATLFLPHFRFPFILDVFQQTPTTSLPLPIMFGILFYFRCFFLPLFLREQHFFLLTLGGEGFSFWLSLPSACDPSRRSDEEGAKKNSSKTRECFIPFIRAYFRAETPAKLFIAHFRLIG